MDQLKLRAWFRKYRYVLLVLLAGLALMLLPGPAETAQEPVQLLPEPETANMETRLEAILGRISGAGEVAVMLTESAGETVIYQTDGENGDTVLVTDAQRNEEGLVRSREPPRYLGAVVVCRGADSAAVRLAIVEAVSNVTGLGSDRISVLKME